MSCDYNGWNDAPEDEREALDAYEAAAEKARVEGRRRFWWVSAGRRFNAYNGGCSSPRPHRVGWRGGWETYTDGTVVTCLVDGRA